MNWCSDMNIAPMFDVIDIVDYLGVRIVDCYLEGGHWYGLDTSYYEPVPERVYSPKYWMLVEMPKDNTND
tara:strand:- start:3154 stop:3363 length:210 start_codon:yes stop_codon:yes gene_type:complete